jgi:hypothetical protein
MKKKPSDELKELFNKALEEVTPHGLHEVADRAALEIAWMQGYYRRIGAAIAAGDDQTFVDAQKELQFAKTELVALTRLYQEVLAGPWW